jgi:hypothetical protein
MKRLSLFIIASLLLIPSASFASPGGTDALGGHTCWTDCELYGLETGEYHYHLDGGEVMRTYDQNTTVFNRSLADRLEGRILLQVEDHGEAWYLPTEDGRRFYMKDGAAAYEMMRSFGLGITNDDLDRIPSVESTEDMNAAASLCGTDSFTDNLAGDILLQVEEHGEAWYVDPTKCLRIYMKDGSAAYTIMRYLGLGITNADLAKIVPAPLPAKQCGTDLLCFKQAVTADEEVLGSITGEVVFSGLDITSTVEMHHIPLNSSGKYTNSRTITAYHQAYTEETLEELRHDGTTEEEIQMNIAEMEEDSVTHIGNMLSCTYENKQDMLDQLDAWIGGTYSTSDMSFADCTSDHSEM